MPDELIAYIRDQVKRNTPREQITNTLKEVGGWNDTDISEVFVLLDKEKLVEVSTEHPVERPTGFQQPPVEKKIGHPVTLFVGILLILIIFLLGGFVAYQYSQRGFVLPTTQPQVAPTTTDQSREPNLRGKIILSTSTSALPKTISSLPSSPYNVYPVAKDGTFEVPFAEKSVNKIIAAAPDKDFWYIAIVLPNDIQPNSLIRVDATSTAVALVFSDEKIISSDPFQASTTLSLINKSPATGSFITLLIKKTITSKDPLNDPLVKTGLEKAVAEVLATISKEKE